MAFLAYSNSLCPLRMMMRVSGSSFRTIRASSRPSINGILMSVSRISGRFSRSCGRATSPSGASPRNRISCSCQGTLSRILSRAIRSSSTRNSEIMSLLPIRSVLNFKQLPPANPTESIPCKRRGSVPAVEQAFCLKNSSGNNQTK